MDGSTRASAGTRRALNGLTELLVTKLDVLSGLETVKICTGYRAYGQSFDDMPPHQSVFHDASPIYEELEGWQEEIDECRRSRTCPSRLRPTCAAWRSWSASRSAWSASAPLANRACPSGERRVKVLVVGGGGREHALAWGLARSPLVTELHVAPGNAGIAQLATCHDVAADDVEQMVKLVDQLTPDLVVVGPEAPLVAGLADRVRAMGVAGLRTRRRRAPGWKAPRRGRSR